MMTSLFRKIVISRQQIRFIPRYSQAWPEKHALSKNTCIENSTRHETDCDETVKQASNYPKIKWKSRVDQSASLLVSVEKQKRDKTEKRRTVIEKLKKDLKETENSTIDDQGNLIYIKMQNNDPRINKIMSIVKTQKKGIELMLLEGKRLIKEALETGCKLEYILFSRMKEIEYLKNFLPKYGNLYKMPYREMQIWSDLTTNPGIMGIFKTPPPDFFEPKEALPLTIICDNVREPNNLGAILRTSSGVGCKQLILTKGCVNVWGTKVLRSACGAHFKVKMSKDVNWDNIRTMLPENANIFIADNNVITSPDDNVDSIENLTAHIPVLPYFSTNFKLCNHVVLVIGGETEGLSVESYKLARDFNGVRLNVPLSNQVESLNTGTALGIIVFEIKRQLMNLQEMKPAP